MTVEASTVTRTLRILSDPVRLRILALLARQELTVTELTEVMNLGQSRVSGHLGKLAEDGLVRTRREGRFVFYCGEAGGTGGAAALVPPVLAGFAGTAEAEADEKAMRAVISRRATEPPPGTLGKDYLPGRTWEGFAKALLAVMPAERVADLGIGTGELSLLLAEPARHLIAVDRDPLALAAARARAQKAGLASKMSFREGDLHDPPIAKGEVDLWVLSQVLHLAADPGRALAAAAARLVAGGRIIVLDLLTHREGWARARLGHVRLGFSESGLERLLRQAGFDNIRVRRVARDRKPPHFVSLLGTGRKP